MTLLIFDCDGVLVDSEILHAEIDCEIAKDLLGLKYNLEERIRYRHSVSSSLKSLYALWETETGKPLSDSIKEEMTRRRNEALYTRLKLVPHIESALNDLKDFPSCVASGTPLPTLEIGLRATKICDYFAPNIFSATMVEKGKPAPDIFLYAAEKMKTEPKDCIVIEDSIAGVQAGIAAGMKVIGFTGASHCTPDHAEKLGGAKTVIANMRELSAVIKAMI